MNPEKDSLVERAYVRFSEDHDQECEQLLARIRTEQTIAAQRLQVLYPRHFQVRRWIMRTAIGLAAMLLIGMGWFILGSSTATAYAQLADAVESSKSVEWVHARNTLDSKPNEYWITFRPFRYFRKTPDCIEYWDGPSSRQYLYDTHSKVLTVAPLQDAGDLGSKADFLGAMLAMIDGIKAQHPDAVLTRQRQTIDGKPSIVYILSEQKREGSDPAAEIRVDVATNRISSIWMRVQMLGPDGRVVTAKSVTDLDYPPSGPADIYGMGVPRDARVQDLTPPNAVKDLDGKVSAAMEAFAPSYYAIIAKIRSVPESDRSEAMQEFWAVYKKNGKYRVQTYSIDPHQYGKLPADDFKALESMAARHRISSLLFIPDRKSEVYVSLDRSGRLSRQRTAGMTLDKVVEGFAWSYGWNRQPLDQRYGQVAALVPATNPSRSTLITRQETWQGVRVNPGRWNNPTRLRESFDPRHDYIRQTYEWLGSYQAEWQRDPRMLQELQSEPDVLRYRQAHAWTVLEYARTPQGQWYPKMLREEFEAAGKHAPGDRVIDLPRQATIYHIHLDSARDISDSLLDPDQVSPALFGTPTPAERQSR